jgi:hypothetical protein
MSVKVVGHNSPAAYGSVYQHGQNSDVNLSVRVDDKKVRELGVDHDGFEKVFALVPQKDGDWKRVDLQYGGSYGDRGGGGPYDNYSLSLSGWKDNVSLDDLRNRGVAFGVEVSGAGGKDPSTVWLQGFDDNYKLKTF